MSRSAKARAPFGDSVYDFRLTIGQLEELQELTDAGPEEIYQRISEGRWRLADLRQSRSVQGAGPGRAIRWAGRLLGVEAAVLVHHRRRAGRRP